MADITYGWEGIAGTAISISIILGGISLGVGRAFSLKKLERFGINELFQSVVNAAILGFAASLSALVLQVGSEFAPHNLNSSCTANISPSAYILCSLNESTTASFALSSNLTRLNNVLGYYQTLDLHFGNFSISPLANLHSASGQLSNSASIIQLSAFGAFLNAQLLSFTTESWFGILFAAGLVLRSFFITRKFGAFLIGASLAFIIFYPLALMMFPPPDREIAEASASASEFLSNPSYRAIPITDLNGNNAIAERLYNMSFAGGPDFTGDLTLVIERSTRAASAAFFSFVLVPLFSLAATLVLIKELSQSFAGDIASEISGL